ncbi:MAG: hypothetical protein A4E28_00602 [Methanocella sp. PtaU1.Bin125]|nr:MAG: hypothetical protein A4E28_00602 [Methanocella sp. PtaU1.Bin125]
MQAVNNSTGGVDLSTTAGITDFLVLTLATFVGSWIILCIIMYIIAPFFGKYADQRSRMIYSAVYTLPFAIIFALGLGGTISILTSMFGSIVALLMAFVIVFVLVIFQSFLIGLLTSKGYLKMESRARQQQRMTKGKRK